MTRLGDIDGAVTPEATAFLDARWDGVLRLDLSAVTDRFCRVVVITADVRAVHAAIGATLADLCRGGSDVILLVLSAGTDTGSSTGVKVPGRQMNWILRGENPEADEAALSDHLRKLLDDRTLVFVPGESGTPHELSAATEVVRAAARRHGASVLEYVRLRQCTSRVKSFWSRARWLVPSLQSLRSKDSTATRRDRRRMPLAVAELAVVPRGPDLAARLDGLTGAARRRDERALPFEAMFDGTDDPWHLDDSFYERRRLAVLLACLGRPRYRRIVEIGCSTGQLSSALARRADEVIAVDSSPAALAVARGRAGSDGIRWVLGSVPQDYPELAADLVVLSEVGYFLDGPDLLATIRAARRHLSAGGEIVVANWRHDTEHIPLDGPTVQRQVAAMLDLPRRARYEDTDLIVEVWGQPMSVHSRYGPSS